jgi:uncharacterized protein
MITESIKSFAEGVGHAFVATSDLSGNPHLAAGRGILVEGLNRLVFEAWFCGTTLKNLQENPKIAVAVVDPATGKGYQFFGRVEGKKDTAILNGFLPEDETAGLPQVQWRLEVRVDSVVMFSTDAHSDRPLG